MGADKLSVNTCAAQRKGVSLESQFVCVKEKGNFQDGNCALF